MTFEQAKTEAIRQGDGSGMMRLVYQSTIQPGHYGVNVTLPTFGRRVGNYYPPSYVRSGWFDAEMK